MATCVVTIKIMPESPDVDLAVVQTAAESAINDFTGEDGEKRASMEPIAFGLKALKLIFVMDEKIGSTESLEQALASIEGVNSVDVVDVRRAIG
jgi:elongation factor 1-beta